MLIVLVCIDTNIMLVSIHTNIYMVSSDVEKKLREEGVVN